jgi:ABC-type multidrug transport system ATPase subunit
LYDDLTVAENLHFRARSAGASDVDATAALDLLGLGRLADTVVARLSAGQRRRASIACVVARRPELWLLDEPHAGLDQTWRDELDELLRSATRAGATVLMASHEIERAARVAARTVTMAGGVVVASAAEEAFAGVP